MTSYTDREIYYVCHPVAPTAEELADADHDGMAREPRASAINANVNRAMRWLRWLRLSFQESTFIAPWIASIMSGDDDSDPAQREAGLVDCEAVAHLVGKVVMVGGRIGSGGRREALAASDITDLTFLGAEPPDVVTGETFVRWTRRVMEAGR